MSVSIKTLFLSLSSLCVTYPRWRSVRLKTQKLFFLVFLLSVEALLEADPDIFLICNIFFFSLSLFLCVESILGDGYSKQNYKKVFLSISVLFQNSPPLLTLPLLLTSPYPLTSPLITFPPICHTVFHSFLLTVILQRRTECKNCM